MFKASVNSTNFNQYVEVYTELKELGRIKCLVWDLDDTLWQGILLEDMKITINEEISKVIKELDERGILQSIASRNDYSAAMAKLKEFGMDQYFLYPQIHWGAKSLSIKSIAERLNISPANIAFVDDQTYELEEVSHMYPEILCLEAMQISSILTMAEFMPRFITPDAKIRRQMYQQDILRKQEEEQFKGANKDFLSTLNMELTIHPAAEDDLQRAEELTVRTHQLNSTGIPYSYHQLSEFSKSKDYRVYMAQLEDRFGTYGKIGLALISTNKSKWVIKLLLTSCRVMSRGIGNVFLHFIMKEAKEHGVKLFAEFRESSVNRMMYVTYKFAGFNEMGEKDDGTMVLEHDLSEISSYPDYIHINEITY